MKIFRKLRVWEMGMTLVEDTYKLCSDLPPEEKYGLANQMRRCAVSIPSNISESCSRSSDLDMARFIEIALGSAFELETQFLISERLGYLEKNKCENLIIKLTELQKSSSALINSLKKK